MGQKKRETRPSSRPQEPQQVDFTADEETVWSFLTYLPICDQLYILKRHKSVIFAIKSRSAKRIYKYTNHLHESIKHLPSQSPSLPRPFSRFLVATK